MKLNRKETNLRKFILCMLRYEHVESDNRPSNNKPHLILIFLRSTL